MSILFTILVIILVVWGIVKKYPPQAVLLFGGMALLLATVLFHWGTGVLPMRGKSTGSLFFDFFQHIKELFTYRLGGLGLRIMAVSGFAVLMSGIGAAERLTLLSVKPLSKIGNPYMLLALFYVLGVVLNMFITSATGLGLLLMAVMYPILVKLGVSPLATVGMIVTTGCLELGPVQTNVVVGAKYSGLPVVEYFTQYELIRALPVMVVVAILHFFWQRFMDKKAGHNFQEHRGDEAVLTGVKTNDVKAPLIYAMLPIVPFILLFVFSSLTHSSIHLSITSALFVSVFIAMIFEFFRHKLSIKNIFDNLMTFFKGMQAVFGVVTLIIGGQLLAEGLQSIGFINSLVDLSANVGIAGAGMTAVMAVIILIASILMGSGNASFLSLVNLAPGIADRFAIPVASMVAPMQLISSIGRAFSPIAAVVLATSGMAKLNPIEVVYRTWVPLAGGVIVLLISIFVLG